MSSQQPNGITTIGNTGHIHARRIITHEPVVLPPGGFTVHILRGKARINFGGEDVILAEGSMKHIARRESCVIIAPSRDGDFLEFAIR